MAQRRMFSPDIVASDAFLEMPTSSQALYFHLGMYADDDGFVNPRRIMRMIGVSEDDLRVLVAKRFVLPFENGVVVIKHWRINNLVRKDWYKETKYLDQKKHLKLKENGAYTEVVNEPLTDSLTQVSSGKDSLDNLSLVKEEEPAAHTPAHQAELFFNSIEDQNKLFQALVSKGLDSVLVQTELGKFIRYWTELDKKGKKQRWQKEEFFELRRRIQTWFSRAQGYSQNNKQPKGITL